MFFIDETTTEHRSIDRYYQSFEIGSFGASNQVDRCLPYKKINNMSKLNEFVKPELGAARCILVHTYLCKYTTGTSWFRSVQQHIFPLCCWSQSCSEYKQYYGQRQLQPHHCKYRQKFRVTEISLKIFYKCIQTFSCCAFPIWMSHSLHSSRG